MTIHRFSSRRQKLDRTFLCEKLQGAQAYDRIAGYFSSSMLEVAGEAIASMTGIVRIVCNSDLNVRDVEAAKSAANYALRREWCASEPEQKILDGKENGKDRFAKLYQVLRSGKMQVKVLPRDKFGLVHGKAGVITLADGTQTSFMGSTNETYHAWKLHYELLWEDDDPEAIEWVQEEFNSLWNHPLALPLADFVIEDIGRISQRTVIPSIEAWREIPDAIAQAGATIIETPVYRQEYGLWEHQKYFVNIAFQAHKTPHGARYILADMVGLGKTIQLAMSAMLMALYGDKPILILAPKPLLWQWQEEMKTLLDLPSAVWNGKQWVDENGLDYPAIGAEGIKTCPRRIGLVSQGIITSKSEAGEYLKQIQYECVIVDEAHRARRENLGVGCEKEECKPNNLLQFLFDIADRTKSLLLATATPVQLNPIEAFDLLRVLAQGNDMVLGNTWSNWRNAEGSLLMARGDKTFSETDPESDRQLWLWVCNPIPASSEHKTFSKIRRTLQLKDTDFNAGMNKWDKLRLGEKQEIRSLADIYGKQYNPFIRHIIRRTREYLENTYDPETGEPYLQPVRVQLLGENDTDAIALTPYLRDAYAIAEEFCQSVSQRMKGSGFLKTLLLRRVGSSINAGMITAQKLLGKQDDWDEENEDEDPHPLAPSPMKGEEGQDSLSPSHVLGEGFRVRAKTSEFADKITSEESILLEKFIQHLKVEQDNDPKYNVVKELLLDRNWLDLGCIIFSQYFDSVWWLANQLTRDLPNQEVIGIYAGGQKSGHICNGEYTRCDRNVLKKMVQSGEIRLILGTDAASEGLNLQKLGSLINLDLPWNPTRLEQRKGRIQRIGQTRETVLVYNMRYKGSVEDRVRDLLSDRLQSIHQMFGQIPDTLQTIWVDEALGDRAEAKQTIDKLPDQHPFEMKYNQIQTKVNWESCTQVLDSSDRKKALLQSW